MRSHGSIGEALMRVAGVCAACLVMCAGATTAWAADSASGGLEIIGGDGARTVQLQLCPRVPVDSGPELACVKDSEGRYRGGRLTVRVRNDGDGADEPLKVAYLRNGATPTELSGDESKPVFLLSETQEPPTLSGRQPLDVSVGFALSPGKAAATLSGSLVLTAGQGKPVSVPVTVEVRTFSGLTVSPSTLSIDSGEPNADLTVEGPELAEYLESHGGEELNTTLHGDGDDTATASLKLRGAGGATRLTSTLTVSGDPPAGKYTGKLVLPELSADTGTATIELNQRKSCLCLVLTFILLLLVVFVGIFVTGIGTRVVTMATRRTLLKEVLDQTYNVFVYVLKRRERDGKPIEIASWLLDDLLGEDPKSRENATVRPGRLQGLPALRASIETARSSADLDEDADRVLDMIARMQRWLRVEPLVRRLALVKAEFEPQGKLPEEKEETGDGNTKDLDPLAWSDSKTLRDTRALLEMARREPADVDKADDLVARLLFQVEWHRRMAAAWETACIAGADPKRPKEIRALDGALGDESKVGTRSATEQDGLTATLEGMLRKHGNIELDAIGDIPGEKIGRGGRKRGVTRVEWNASANLFTGWATLDGPSYGQLANRAATSSRARYMPSWDAIGREAGRFDRADAGWTVAILVFAAVTYGTATYGESWGSAKDLTTAFLAGSLGKVTIDWAALPIFQSVRLRKAKKD